MTVRNVGLESIAAGTEDIKQIGSWTDVGLTVKVSGAVSPVGVVEGSRGKGEITDEWEDLMAYGDAPVQIANSIRRIRMKTTSITSGIVVCEACGN